MHWIVSILAWLILTLVSALTISAMCGNPFSPLLLTVGGIFFALLYLPIGFLPATQTRRYNR